ncbi:MAG: PEP-CTERM sorting domain-containing protein [Planctomycetia bacterium]|jgi:hypothetical protein
MNSPSRINNLLLCCAGVVIALTASSSYAQTHASDIQLLLINSRLATSGGSYPGPLNGRVFEGTFPTNGANNNPGFDSAAGLLQPGEMIRFDFVREVLYWNGTALTTSPRSMTVSLGSTQSTLSPTDISGKPGFVINGGDAQGAFHEHVWFSIGSGAPTGLYGVVLTLGPAGTSTFGTSEPFLMAFSRGATNREAGLDAMAATLVAVPEPTTLGLAAAGLVAGIASRCRRGKSRKRNAVASALRVQ